MNRVRVKICGITRVEDAELAVALGADAIGFVLWPSSPRAIPVDRAREIAERLPAFVARVGVFVDASPNEVQTAMESASLDVAQLHGNEDVGVFERVKGSLVRAVSLATDDALAAAESLPRHVTPLVDAYDRTLRGGTGKIADWARAARLAAVRPIVLAGGLSSANVREAIDSVRPWAIDVSSGVERAPGIKDPDRLRELFAAVRSSNGVRT